jgi:predicted permease
MPMLSNIGRDLQLAFRRLVHDPGYSCTVILILTLTIGANIAVLSVVNTALVRPIPYPQPERLAQLIVTSPDEPVDDSHDGETWEAVRDLSSSVDAAVYSDIVMGVNLAGQNTGSGSRASNVRQQRVSAGFFRVLGVAPALGREFERSEDVPGGPALAILSHALWEQQFQGDPAVIGRPILLRGEAATVIGVMPAGFQSSVATEVWTPLRPNRTEEGSGNNYGILLRLKPGVTMEQADAQAAALKPTLSRFDREQHPHQLRLVSLQAGRTRDLKTPLLLLWAAVALVFVLGCVNVSGMMLSRTSGRASEVAIRVALGASNARVAQEVAIESLVVALAGGALGFLAGLWSLYAMQILGAKLFPILQRVTPDWRVAAADIVLAVIAGVGSALAPVWRTLRVGPGAGHFAARTIAGRRRFLPLGVLAGGQVALTVPLLLSAGLLLHALLKLSALDSGMSHPEHVLTAAFSLQDARYATSARVNGLFDQVLGRLRETPGIQAASAAIHLPYERWMNIPAPVSQPDPRHPGMTNLNYVEPGYFEALGIAVLRGRVFSAADTISAQPVAIANRAFVDRYLAGREPIGAALPRLHATVVGVVGNLVERPGFDAFETIQQAPALYIPAAQTSDQALQSFHTWFSPKWIVRSSLPRAQVRRAVEDAVQSADPLLPLAEFRSISDLKSEAVSYQRFLAVLVSAVGGLGMALAALGMYGLLANLVGERKREFGIRLALGSGLGPVVRAAIAPAVRWATAGALTGCLLALACERLIVNLIADLKPSDPWTLGAVAASLIAAAALAGLSPVLSLIRMNPADTLREE